MTNEDALKIEITMPETKFDLLVGHYLCTLFAGMALARRMRDKDAPVDKKLWSVHMKMYKQLPIEAKKQIREEIEDINGMSFREIIESMKDMLDDIDSEDYL